MKNTESSFGSTIKNMAIGATIGAIATMLISNNNASKKVKKAIENTTDCISSMFKMN